MSPACFPHPTHLSKSQFIILFYFLHSIDLCLKWSHYFLVHGHLSYRRACPLSVPLAISPENEPPPTFPTRLVLEFHSGRPLAFAGTSQLLSTEQLGVLFSFTSLGPSQCNHPVVGAQSVSCESGGKRGLSTVLTEKFLLCVWKNWATRMYTCTDVCGHTQWTSCFLTAVIFPGVCVISPLVLDVQPVTVSVYELCTFI